MKYRGGTVRDGLYSWRWSHRDNPDWVDVRAWYRLPPFGIRFRSEDEALRLLCERIDDWLHRAQIAAELTAQREADLHAREEALQDMEKPR